MNISEEICTPYMVSTFDTFGKFIYGYDEWSYNEECWEYLKNHLTNPKELNISLYDLFKDNLTTEIKWKHIEKEDKDIHIILLWDSLGKWTYQFEFNK